ncbi:hypothetical protein FCV25MIE_22541, partial [Fagus crenata]
LVMECRWSSRATVSSGVQHNFTISKTQTAVEKNFAQVSFHFKLQKIGGSPQSPAAFHGMRPLENLLQPWRCLQ